MITSALLLSSSLLWALKAPPVIYDDISVIGALGMAACVASSAVLLRSIMRSG
jgi:hypothetical protein